MSGLVNHHNLMARYIARHLTKTHSSPAESTRRPATGFRIGKPPDDTSGSAVDKSIGTEITVRNREIRNARIARTERSGGVDLPGGPPAQQAHGPIDTKTRIGPSNSSLKISRKVWGDIATLRPELSFAGISRRHTAQSPPLIEPAKTVFPAKTAFNDNTHCAPGVKGKPPDSHIRPNFGAERLQPAGSRIQNADIAEEIAGIAGNPGFGPERTCRPM